MMVLIGRRYKLPTYNNSYVFLYRLKHTHTHTHTLEHTQTGKYDEIRASFLRPQSHPHAHMLLLPSNVHTLQPPSLYTYTQTRKNQARTANSTHTLTTRIFKNMHPKSQLSTSSSLNMQNTLSKRHALARCTSTSRHKLFHQRCSELLGSLSATLEGLLPHILHTERKAAWIIEGRSREMEGEQGSCARRNEQEGADWV